MRNGDKSLSDEQKNQLRLVELFVAQATAHVAADLAGVHRNSAALYFHKVRQCIGAQMAQIEPEMAVFEYDGVNSENTQSRG